MDNKQNNSPLENLVKSKHSLCNKEYIICDLRNIERKKRTADSKGKTMRNIKTNSDGVSPDFPIFL